MLPQVRGRLETGRQIALYTLVLTAISVLPILAGLGAFYLAAALLLGGGFMALSLATWRGTDRRWARRTFEYSLLYLALLFAAMVVDAVLRTSPVN